MQAPGSVPATDPLRGLKRMTVVNIILLSVQAWTGDVVNLFAVFPAGAVNGFGGFFQGLESAGPEPIAVYHALGGSSPSCWG